MFVVGIFQHSTFESVELGGAYVAVDAMYSRIHITGQKCTRYICFLAALLMGRDVFGPVRIRRWPLSPSRGAPNGRQFVPSVGRVRVSVSRDAVERSSTIESSRTGNSRVARWASLRGSVVCAC